MAERLFLVSADEIRVTDSRDTGFIVDVGAQNLFDDTLEIPVLSNEFHHFGTIELDETFLGDPYSTPERKRLVWRLEIGDKNIGRSWAISVDATKPEILRAALETIPNAALLCLNSGDDGEKNAAAFQKICNEVGVKVLSKHYKGVLTTGEKHQL